MIVADTGSEADRVHAIADKLNGYGVAVQLHKTSEASKVIITKTIHNSVNHAEFSGGSLLQAIEQALLYFLENLEKWLEGPGY